MENTELKLKEDEEVLQPPIEQDDEADFFSSADKPRENFEDVEDETEEPPSGDGASTKEPIKLSETTSDDEANFILFMNMIDSTRAMGFSYYVNGDLDLVSKFTVYKDWKDPQHQQLLHAGRIVAKKYSLAAFDKMPEFMICLALLLSTVALFSQAKKMKAEQRTASEATPNQPTPQQETKTSNGRIVVMDNKSKKAK